MSALTEAERDVALHFVTLGWVARRYETSRVNVLRAARDGRLSAVWLRGGPKRGQMVFDVRNLPPEFPYRHRR